MISNKPNRQDIKRPGWEMILDTLYPGLEIDRVSLKNHKHYPDMLPTTRERIAVLEGIYSEIPADYLNIVRQIDGVALQGKTTAGDHFYISVLSVLEAADYVTSWYPFLSEELPGCFFFGRVLAS